jgi:hypothetical protein
MRFSIITGSNMSEEQRQMSDSILYSGRILRDVYKLISMTGFSLYVLYLFVYFNSDWALKKNLYFVH